MKVFKFKDIKALNPCYTDYDLKKLTGGGITMQGILSSDVSRKDAPWVALRLIPIVDRVHFSGMVARTANEGRATIDPRILAAIEAAELYPQPQINYYQIRRDAAAADAAAYAYDAAARLAQDAFLIEAEKTE